MKKNDTNEHQNETKVFFNYGTHTADVIKFSDVSLSVLDETLENGKIVIAKDTDDTFYVTVKSYVDSGLLDPYKCYRKNLFVINQIENADNGPMFEIKFKGLEPGLVI